MSDQFPHTDQQVRHHMLAMLIRDFGYESLPTYGHAPLRHQFAWDMAVESMTAEEVTAFVQRCRADAAAEKEVPPDPYVDPPVPVAALQQLVKGWREARAHTYASENADHYRGFDAGLLRCAEMLERLIAASQESSR